MLTTGTIRGNFFSKNITSATAVAQTTIEGAQRVGYTAVNTYVTDSSKVPPTVSLGGVSFSQSASVTNNSPASNMATKRSLIYDKTGMVLFSSLLFVSLLMAAGMGAWIAIQNDYRITTNLRQANAGFYLAEAGIEWAKQQIKQVAIHPPRPADRVQSFSSGAFSVVYISSTPVTLLTAHASSRCQRRGPRGTAGTKRTGRPPQRDRRRRNRSGLLLQPFTTRSSTPSVRAVHPPGGGNRTAAGGS